MSAEDDIDLVTLHRECGSNRNALRHAPTAGCFYCLRTFPPTTITEWIDPPGPSGQTALCPSCGIDAVIPLPGSMREPTRLLDRMRRYWFDS